VRRGEAVAELVDRYPDRLRPQLLDLTDTAAIRSVVERSLAELGRIDVVVSNAGYGLFGAAEELSDQQIDDIVATSLVARRLLYGHGKVRKRGGLGRSRLLRVADGGSRLGSGASRRR
jgi:NAD(P)-dependent dehydrogenase (short-subunit alcohol dehydrogenase family)